MYVGKGKNAFCKIGSESDIMYGPYANYTREELLEALDGVTDISTEVANQIRCGEIKNNDLGDGLFDASCPLECVGTSAYFKEGQIYVRRNSTSLLSDLVHEGKEPLFSKYFSITGNKFEFLESISEDEKKRIREYVYIHRRRCNAKIGDEQNEYEF